MIQITPAAGDRRVDGAVQLRAERFSAGYFNDEYLCNLKEGYLHVCSDGREVAAEFG
ncbi:hypothetical protein KRX56_00990 [Dermabacteraceae bacterium TAE3-ERU27]|nr:hypothetical protein [Dermabacteraceae bacterium TAE3-ERU27]